MYCYRFAIGDSIGKGLDKNGIQWWVLELRFDYVMIYVVGETCGDGNLS